MTGIQVASVGWVRGRGEMGDGRWQTRDEEGHKVTPGFGTAGKQATSTYPHIPKHHSGV
jgi:hypothetical protein